jgi:hypothetical protein
MNVKMLRALLLYLDIPSSLDPSCYIETVLFTNHITSVTPAETQPF